MTRLRKVCCLTWACLVALPVPGRAADPSHEVRTLRQHQDWVGAVAFSPDSRWLATGSADKTARIWDLATGETRAICRGHTDAVCATAFAPDGKVLATGSYDGTA